MKKFLNIIVVLFCISVFAIPVLAKDKPKVGFLVHDLTNPFWKFRARGTKEESEKN